MGFSLKQLESGKIPTFNEENNRQYSQTTLQPETVAPSAEIAKTDDIASNKANKQPEKVTPQIRSLSTGTKKSEQGKPCHQRHKNTHHPLPAIFVLD